MLGRKANESQVNDIRNAEVSDEYVQSLFIQIQVRKT